MLLLWSTTLSSIGGIILGILVLLKAKKQIDNLFFSLVSIVISLEVLANYFSLSSDSASITLFWIRAVMFIVPYLMLSIYYFCSSYLNSEYKFNFKIFFIIAFFTIIISIINITPLAYTSVTISQTGAITPTTGPGLPLNGLQIIPLFILSIVNMVKNSKKKTISQKDQGMIKFSLYLFLVTFGLQIITSFVIVTLFNYTRLVPLGNFLTLIFVILITVSIFYYRAFKINLVGAVLFATILGILMFAEIVTASGLQSIIEKIIVFCSVSFIGLQLIKSVKNEIKQKEELQVLAKKLDEANKHLEELDEAKDNFLSMAAHELNTPIAAIEGYLSMIIDEKMAGEVNDKLMDYLKNIYGSSKRLANLVKNLLNVSRIESNRIHLLYTEVQTEDIIDQAIAEVKIKADEVGHKLTFEKPKPALPKTWFDVDRVTEVIINMIGNAIKYTDPPGIINISAHTDGDKIVVAIKDNGRGIPKDKEDHIFEKFSQVNVMKDQVKGTGLGMFIVKNLVELHKGKVWFKSSVDEKDHGTTFYFSIPILKEKPADPHEGEGALFQTGQPKESVPAHSLKSPAAMVDLKKSASNGNGTEKSHHQQTVEKLVEIKKDSDNKEPETVDNGTKAK